MEEQKKELNLVEILKDCPKGMKMYSTIYGEVEFERIDYSDGVIYPICFSKDSALHCVTEGGLYLVGHAGECSLFPSRDNRDWSTFKAPKPKWNSDTMQPFDKVLVRDGYGEPWKCDFFVSKDWPEGENYPYMAVTGYYKMMVPYNEDTKHLIATRDEAPEYYRV